MDHDGTLRTHEYRSWAGASLTLAGHLDDPLCAWVELETEHVRVRFVVAEREVKRRAA